MEKVILAKKLKEEIKKLKKENSKLKKLVYLDDLTRLYNRRALIEIGNRYFDSLKKLKQRKTKRRNDIKSLNILFLDIDDFKKINDKYGHEKGDRVLKSFSKFLLSNFRKTDIVSRYGGEEFVVLLVNVSYKIAKKISLKLRQKTEKASFNGLKITASIGVLNLRRERSFKELVKKADGLMYQAKKRGKNQVVFI
jgi:diguanylate cyclase (GGDEF)-like protein